MRKLLFFLLFAQVSLCAKSVTQCTDYPQFCLQAAKEEGLFRHFRRSAPFRTIMENCSYQHGLDMLQAIQDEYPHLLSRFNEFCYADQFGNPQTESYPGIGKISPATLRYIKIAAELQKEFGDLKELHIVEIGGGYGGQCRIIHDITGFASYTIIDLPECTALIKKYLAHFGLDSVNVIASPSVTDKIPCDLIISNYALSEIGKEEQLNYFENVIDLAPRGYLIYNEEPAKYNKIPSLSAEDLKALLSKNHPNIRIGAESPSTGENNYMILWSNP